MRLREVYLSDREMLGVTATRIWNLDLSDPIMFIKLKFEALTDYAAGCNGNRLPDCVSKIEVVDGSDVLYSTDLFEALAQHLYSGHEMPWANQWDCGLDVSDVQCCLWFSRDTSDQQFMLDPKKFVNPQLKITYNFPVAAGDYVAASQFISVIAMVCENPVRQPEGFLMTKQVYEWLTVIGATETIDMPRDYPWRFLMSRLYYPAFAMYAVLSHYKISCDIDKFVPLNMRAKDLAQENFGIYPSMHMQSQSMGDGAALPLTSYHYFGWTHGTTCLSNNNNQIALPYGMASGVIQWANGALGAIGNFNAVVGTVHGSEFGFCEPYRFGNLVDPEEWFDPTSYMSVRLIIEQLAVAGQRAGIVLQQKRNY